jgi:curved DNA-binding protein CbpA
MRVSRIAVLSVILLHVVFSLAQVLEDRIVDKDLYAVLGVKASATVQEIKKAFRKLAQTQHPDKARTGAKAQTGKFQDISEAYDILTNKALRDEYDSRRFINSAGVFDMDDLENADEQHGAFWVNEMDSFDSNDLIVEEYPYYPEILGLRDVPFSSGTVLYPCC